MATPNYFVGPSIATDDTATFQDREDGSQELAVTLTREDDGATDARHPVTLTIDLDVSDDNHVIVRQNGTELNGADLAGIAELIEQAVEGVGDWRGGLDLALAMVNAAQDGGL